MTTVTLDTNVFGTRVMTVEEFQAYLSERERHGTA